MDVYEKHRLDLSKIKNDCVVVLERIGYPDEYESFESVVRPSFDDAKSVRDEWFKREWDYIEKHPECFFSVNIYLKDLCSYRNERWEPDTFIPLY